MPFDAGPDLEKAREKRAEIEALLAGYLGSAVPSPEALSGRIFDVFVRMTPPVTPPVLMYNITAQLLRNGLPRATSRKPGNILLNIRELFDAVSAGVFTVTSTVQFPWAVPFAAILLWNSLHRAAEITLAPRDAAVLLVMWENRDRQYEVPKRGLLEKCNAGMASYGQEPITERELAASCDNLLALRSIEPSRAHPEHWWLREWVSVKYE